MQQLCCGSDKQCKEAEGDCWLAVCARQLGVQAVGGVTVGDCQLLHMMNSFLKFAAGYCSLDHCSTVGPCSKRLWESGS